MSAPLTLEGLAGELSMRRLLTAARRRVEATGGDLEGVSVSLRDASEEERRRVELLLGTVKRGKSLRVPLDRLDRALRESQLRAGLIELLELAGGPLRDRPGERAAESRAEEELWAEARSHPAVARHSGLTGWLDELRATGRLRRLGGAEAGPLLERALRVLVVLPATGVDRAVLAAEQFGDAHALDDSRPEARLVLSAMSHLSGEPADGSSGAKTRRRLWELHGVVSDAVSSTVLMLRLAPEPAGPVTSGLAELARSGAVVPVTLEMLRAERLRWPAIEQVFVTENPTVPGVASRRLGDRCPPMVCVSGMPSLAARKLLDGLRDAGVRLLYHGDFGAGGLRIGNIVIGEHGASPWRFRGDDYEEALAASEAGAPISAPVPDAVWDPALAPAIRRAGREIQEEQVLPALLDDLLGCHGSRADPV